MDQKEIRKYKIHQRIHVLRRRDDRRSITRLSVLAAALVFSMWTLLQNTHTSGVVTVASGYGSVLLRDGADIYVLVGLAAFVAGVAFTVICIRFRMKKIYKKET